jgi:hypothetical protein
LRQADETVEMVDGGQRIDGTLATTEKHQQLGSLQLSLRRQIEVAGFDEHPGAVAGVRQTLLQGSLDPAENGVEHQCPAPTHRVRLVCPPQQRVNRGGRLLPTITPSRGERRARRSATEDASPAVGNRRGALS